MYLSEIINQFTEHNEIVRNLSQNTYNNYRGYLSRFLRWIGKDIHIERLDIHTLNDYRMYLARTRGREGQLTKKTQREYLVAIRSLLRYCHKFDIKAMPIEKIDLPKVPDKIVEFLNHDEVKAMLKVAKGKSISDYRNVAILEMLYSTGLRIGELLSLDRRRIDFAERQFTVIGKGGKARIVFVSLRAIGVLKKYLSLRDDNHQALFIDHSSNGESRRLGRRLTHWSVARIIREIAKEANIQKKITCHTFRHSFATDMISNGADIRVVQELLGHASIRTTQIYTHLTNPKLKENYLKFHKL